MKLKKFAIAAALALIPALAACGSDNGGGTDVTPDSEATFEAGTTMAALNQAGTITIGTKFDQPLFGLAGPDGTPEGFDVEMGKIVAAHLGIPADNIEWVETVSQNREPFIQNGQVDLVIATYTINDTRKEVVDFAGPYYIAGQNFLVAAGNPDGITSVDTLGDHTICTVTGSTSEANIREYTDNVLTVDKYSDCLEPIRTGAAQAMTTDNVILAGLVEQTGEEFEVVGDLFTQEPYGIGLAKGDTEFRNWLNDVIEESYANGDWEAAWESTAGVVLETPEQPAVDRY